MYITNVASHLGAWMKFMNDYPVEFQDLHRVVANALTDNELPKMQVGESPSSTYRTDQLSGSFKTAFVNQGWQTREHLTINGNIERRSIIDAVKNSIGVEYTFGKFFYTESVIFVKFPLFINANKFKIGLVITPTKSLAKLMRYGVSSFEMVRDRIRSLAPLPLKYPFAIVGISDQNIETVVEELTTSIDQYLFETLGLSLAEMILQTEKQNYDFKETLSPENDKVAKEICAFANLSGGGLMLVGVDDNGHTCGVLRQDLDDIQLRVMNIASTRCFPLPKIECKAFDLPDHPERCLLSIYIAEIPRKPCMTKEKVYIRVGSAARPATSDEIRNLILGSGA